MDCSRSERSQRSKKNKLIKKARDSPTSRLRKSFEVVRHSEIDIIFRYAVQAFHLLMLPCGLHEAQHEPVLQLQMPQRSKYLPVCCRSRSQKPYPHPAWYGLGGSNGQIHP